MKKAVKKEEKYDIEYSHNSPLVKDFRSFCKINKCKFKIGFPGAKIHHPLLSLYYFTFQGNYVNVYCSWFDDFMICLNCEDFREVLEKLNYHGLLATPAYHFKWV